MKTAIRITGLVTAYLLVCSLLQAQNTGSYFKKGDRVCFVGNSITNNGEFYHFIYLYYATRFPAEDIRFFNCGISGDVAGGVLTRLDKDVFVHNPTHAVLMIGMNDVKRGLYSESKKNDPATPALKAAALSQYRINTNKLAGVFQSKKLNTILLKPTVYDQTGALPAERCYGVDNALDSCGDHVAALARQYHTDLVDFRPLMKEINHQLQAKDSTATLIGKDRVHPASPGHFVMAYQFLKTTGATPYVARMVVNAKGKQEDALNCSIQSIIAGADSVSFTVLENSLPFPVREEAAPALEWVPFMEQYNQELLQIPGLSKGNYELKIDGQSIEHYTAQELAKGVNLAMNKNTPQYKQALKVMDACLQVRKTQATVRNLRFVEFKHLPDSSFSSIPDMEAYLGNHLEKDLKGDHYEYHKSQFRTYIANKNREAEFLKRMETEPENVYKLNKPVPHHFVITKRK